mgnify:FL=1
MANPVYAERPPDRTKRSQRAFLKAVLAGKTISEAATISGFDVRQTRDGPGFGVPIDGLASAIKHLQGQLIKWRELHADARRWLKVALNEPGVAAKDRNVAAGIVIAALKASGDPMDDAAETEDRALESRVETARRLLDTITIDVKPESIQ